ncbi:MAG: hypothetical protein HQL76_18095 [Magnetococcales bacterium]|nr:hypothetical protein [Magnetococcales bacterium]
MTTQKFIRLNGQTGRPEEAFAIDRSNGPEDAGSIVALNRRGKRFWTMLPIGFGCCLHFCKNICPHRDRCSQRDQFELEIAELQAF